MANTCTHAVIKKISKFNWLKTIKECGLCSTRKLCPLRKMLKCSDCKMYIHGRCLKKLNAVNGDDPIPNPIDVSQIVEGVDIVVPACMNEDVAVGLPTVSITTMPAVDCKTHIHGRCPKELNAVDGDDSIPNPIYLSQILEEDDIAVPACMNEDIAVGLPTVSIPTMPAVDCKMYIHGRCLKKLNDVDGHDPIPNPIDVTQIVEGDNIVVPACMNEDVAVGLPTVSITTISAVDLFRLLLAAKTGVQPMTGVKLMTGIQPPVGSKKRVTFAVTSELTRDDYIQLAKNWTNLKVRIRNNNCKRFVFSKTYFGTSCNEPSPI